MIKSVSSTQKVIRAFVLLFTLTLGFSFQAKAQNSVTFHNKSHCVDIKIEIKLCDGNSHYDNLPANSSYFLPFYNKPIKWVKLLSAESIGNGGSMTNPDLLIQSPFNECGLNFGAIPNLPECMPNFHLVQEQNGFNNSDLFISVW